MRKLLLILTIALGSSLAISCTNDTVTPVQAPTNGGGGASDPILP